MLDFPSGERWAVEAKWSRVPRTTKGFHLAPEALAISLVGLAMPV